MALIVADRVKETTTTTGTGAVSMGGAESGFRAFADAFTTADQTYYVIEGAGEWEVGKGTLTTGTPWTLSRDTILASSNSGSVVNFSAGTKSVFCDLPAQFRKAVGFRAYLPTSNQSVTTGTWTKAALSAEDYDLDGTFDAVTNHRFTPTVPGYYQFNWCVAGQATNGTQYISALYKNGTLYSAGVRYFGAASTNTLYVPGSCIVYLNGSTDYVELFGQVVGTAPVFGASQGATFLDGHLIQSA